MAYDIGPKIGIEGEKEFRQAILGINTNLKTLGTEMLAVTSAFDKNDKSTEALSAQNKVLTKQIDEQKNKLEELSKGLEAASQKYGENDKVTQGWQQAVNKATADLNDMERELKENENAAGSFGERFEGLGDILKKSAIAIGAVAVAAGAAALKLGSDVVKQFGELEQNLGGSEAVFGEYAASIQKTGEEAYKNLGVSQSDYLATANKMGALFQGSGVEQQKSLELTEKAMQRAADMASVMGVDMQTALDSVAGAAKGNFTMMDNLGVAMNATNIEAYALSKGLDFTWKTATQAEKAEIAMQMFFENTEQYAGNFAKESTETVTGSIGLLQAALGSFVAGLGNTDADMKNLTENLVDAFQSVVKNVVPIIENLTSALPDAFAAILPVIGDLLPELLTIATDLFQQVLNTILKLLPELIPVAVEAIMTIANTLIDNLPLLIESAFTLIMSLADGIVGALPQLIPAVIAMIVLLTTELIRNIPEIIKFVPELFTALVAAFGEVDWMSLGSDLVKGIWDGISSLGEWILGKVKGFADSIAKGFKDFFGIASPSKLMAEYGKNIDEGLAEGITANEIIPLNAIDTLAGKMVAAARSAVDQTFAVLSNVQMGQLTKDLKALQESEDAKVEKKLREVMGDDDYDRINRQGVDEKGLYTNSQVGVRKIIMESMNAYVKAGNSLDDWKNTEQGQFWTSDKYSSRYNLRDDEFDTMKNVINQTNNIYSPKALSPSEVAKETKKAAQTAVLPLLR